MADFICSALIFGVYRAPFELFRILFLFFVHCALVVFAVFILCWSPYIVFDLLQVFGRIPRTQTNLAVATFIQSLAPLNSAANPIIYCMFSAQVCRVFK